MTDTPTPLAWPSWWKNLSATARFFMGVPIFGPQARLHRELCAKLKARSAGCLKEWGEEPRRKALANNVSQILSSLLDWPNPLFLPRDPFEVLCWDHSAYTIDDLRVDSALVAIEKQLGMPPEDEFWRQARALTFEEVIDRLMARSATSQ